MNKEWKVYFSGNFWGHSGREHAGKEIPTNQDFLWGSNTWKVLSVYACDKGLVLDICQTPDTDKLMAFMDKLKESDAGDEHASQELMEKLEAENPIRSFKRIEAVLNGKQLQGKSGCGICWNPFTESGGAVDMDAEDCVEHYRLDRKKCWMFWRETFSWEAVGKPKIENLQLLLEAEDRKIQGIHMSGLKKGEEIPFVNPVTGEKHVVIVFDIKQNSLKQEFSDDTFDYPRYYTQMVYQIVPELPEGKFFLLDCEESDRPHKKMDINNKKAASIGIIGGADGPTAVFLAGKGKRENRERLACSSLHFQPVEDVEWRMVFMKKELEDIKLEFEF